MPKQEITTFADQQHAPEMPAAGVIAVPAEASSVKPLPFSNEIKDLVLDALLEQGPQGWTWRAGRQVSRYWKQKFEAYAPVHWLDDVCINTRPTKAEYSRLGRFEASRPYFVLLRDTYDVKSRKDRLTFVHDPWHGLSIDIEKAVCKRAFRERRFDIQFGYGDDDELTFDCKTIKLSGLKLKESLHGYQASVPWRSLLCELFNAEAKDSSRVHHPHPH